jgi:hypothetical protein
MSKIKKIHELTIDEHYTYLTLINDEENVDTIELLKLFGFKNVDDMDIAEYKKAMDYIVKQKNLMNPKKGVKKVYVINGRKYSAELNLTQLKAGQFIDFQMYINDFKIEEILSVFLIPMKKTLFGWKKNEYNKGYDILNVQQELLKHFNIGDANELSAFFLTQSTSLLRVTRDYLAKKKLMARWKMLQKKQKESVE